MLRNSYGLVGVVLFSVLLGPAFAWSEDAESPGVSAREILEAQQNEELLVAEKEQSSSSSTAHSTPLSTMLALREAMRINDYAEAGEFLDKRYLPVEMEKYSDEQLLKALAYVWNQQNITNLAEISDCPITASRSGR
jgi:MscS family membrane protein